jgi:very-short-patch-repair endonuclease
MVKPKDYTKQENIIANCLSEFGIRYEQQYNFYPYLVDFFIPDIRMVIEADGIYGHLRKRDIQRDQILVDNYGVEYILHITETSKKEIKDILWQGLNKLPDDQPSP